MNISLRNPFQQYPFALSLSKGERSSCRSWFDKLTTNGK